METEVMRQKQIKYLKVIIKIQQIQTMKVLFRLTEDLESIKVYKKRLGNLRLVSVETGLL